MAHDESRIGRAVEIPPQGDGGRDHGPDFPPRSAPFSYFGSKFMIADWIISHFPAHSIYIEPFGGSACVMIKKRPARHEVFNDLNSEVVNFFRVLREPAKLAELTRLLELTPYSREEYLAAWDRPAGLDPVEAARRFFIHCEMSFARNPNTFTVFSKATTKRGSRPGCFRTRIAALPAVARRLGMVTVENMPALELLRKFDQPGALFYCDPPYVAATRTAFVGDYKSFEMAVDDHVELAAALASLKGCAVVSGYQCDLYDTLYAGWRRLDKEACTLRGEKRTESIWLSPNIPAPKRLF
jgi:DNA adenine methylase